MTSDAMSCEGLRDAAPELALGVLPGEARAEAVAHLAGCRACQAHVDELTATADVLLLAAPALDPPEGFDARVLARIAGRSRRWWWAAVSVAAALLLGFLAIARGPASPAPREAALRARSGQVVGTVFVQPGHRAFVFVALHGAGYDGACTIRLRNGDGRTTQLTGLRLVHGDGSFGTPLATGDVRAIQVLDNDGDALAEANL